jgi:hypothetical protein
MSMGKANFKLLIVVTIVLVVAAMMIHRKKDQASEPLFESKRPLESVEIQKISKIAISFGADEAIELNKVDDDTWGLGSRGNYRVDDEKLRGMVLTLSQMQLMDRLTSNPDKYDHLGLGDEPETARVVLYDKDGSELVNLAIGKERKRNTDSSTGFTPSSGHFVRLEKDASVYVASEVIRIDSTPMNWLQRDLLDVKKEGVQHIHIDSGTTESIQLTRTETSPFELEGELEPGYTVNTSKLSQVTSALTGLRFDDVLTQEDPQPLEIDFDTHFKATLKNGLVYHVDSGSIDNDRYLRAATSYSKMDDLSLGDERTSDSVKAQEMGSGSDQVEEINNRLKPWIFKIPNYKYDNLARKRSAILDEPAEEDEDGQKADLINSLPTEGLPEGLDLSKLKLDPRALSPPSP